MTKLHFYITICVLTVFNIAEAQVSCYPQTEESGNNPTCFLDIQFSGIIPIYEYPNGKVIAEIGNKIDEEELITFGLLGKNDSMFCVAAYDFRGELLVIGWTYKSEHLQVYDRAYQPEVVPLILYEKPDINSHIVVSKRDYTTDAHIVIDYCHGWLKIRTQIGKSQYEGWIPPEMQCGEPYTTCN